MPDGEVSIEKYVRVCRQFFTMVPAELADGTGPPVNRVDLAVLEEAREGEHHHLSMQVLTVRSPGRPCGEETESGAWNRN